ncbi:MAG: CHAT domain-containing tetratricopeptide repeat protein [Reichenbachiella sp.]|uniref:CHAT domain-containing tetratricopeptide repeat protein n=1 Tax=Reichenbachiella sp. TaxID=2184521 RepID=UPI0029671053|nr:CHAT domain-containing tetratricopeptide repeat protein [Reichenbachiella sp.]MDW3210684.1 CHAT domain-containing tetratricopeptide repeat protein [Reichenbachiella sp.]
MKHLTLPILFLLLLAQPLAAQFKIGKLKLDDLVKKENLEAVNTLFDTDSEVAKLKAEQLKKDTSFYNYIFSQGNRASFFANRDSQESLLYTLGSDYTTDGETVEPEVYEKIFELNRTAEFSIYIHPEIATYKFLEAIDLFTNAESFSQISLDSVFDIRQMLTMDTVSIEEKYAIGKTMANLAITIHAEGKYNLSEGLMKNTINYFKEEIGNECIGLASLYNNYAVILQSQGKYTSAEEYFNKAANLLEKHDKENSLSHAIMTSNLALYYNEIGQAEEAESSIAKAMTMAGDELRAKGRDNVSFKINQGLIYYSSGKYNEAENIFNEVLELKRKRMARNQTDYANVENYLASVLMESGKLDQVQSLLEDALKIFAQKYNTQHPAYIKTNHNLGKFHLYQGNYTEAQNILTEVNEAYDQYFGTNHPDYLRSLEDLAVIDWKQGNYSSANERFKQVISSNLDLVEENFAAMSEYEKGQYWAQIRPSILKFYNYACERGTEEPALLTEMYNIQLKTKGILFSASTKMREEILSSDNEGLKTLYLNWQRAKEDLLLYYTYSKTQLEEMKIDLPSAEQKANQLEKELSKVSSDFASANKLPSASLQDIKSSLSPTDVAIEVIGFPTFKNSFTSDKTYAFLIADPNAQHPSLALINNGNELDGKYAKGYQNMVRLKIDNPILYEKYWQVVDKKLGGVKNVHLSLDGIYFQVNISALRKPDQSFVSDGMDFHLYSSTRDLLNQSSSSKNKKADFFGYPTYGNQGLLVSLPGTKAEIETISQITRSKGYQVGTYMQGNASEDNFKKISSPSLLHVATHGFFLPEDNTSSEKVLGIEVSQAKANPLLRSGLMLANAENAMQSSDYEHSNETSKTDNGILTAYEVLTLDLKDTDLVVLSACETGLGEIKSGEGVYGLQRAFQVAGAESVIMSLWKVSDEATKNLMTYFYGEWMNGKSKNDAFISAQKRLRQDFPEPYYWGAFVLLN